MKSRLDDSIIKNNVETLTSPEKWKERREIILKAKMDHEFAAITRKKEVEQREKAKLQKLKEMIKRRENQYEERQLRFERQSVWLQIIHNASRTKLWQQELNLHRSKVRQMALEYHSAIRIQRRWRLKLERSIGRKVRKALVVMRHAAKLYVKRRKAQKRLQAVALIKQFLRDHKLDILSVSTKSANFTYNSSLVVINGVFD